MDQISSFFYFVTNLPNCSAHPKNRFFAISQLWVDESWWNLHEECIYKISLFWLKLIALCIYLAEISQKKTHLPNCSAHGVLSCSVTECTIVHHWCNHSLQEKLSFTQLDILKKKAAREEWFLGIVLQTFSFDGW